MAVNLFMRWMGRGNASQLATKVLNHMRIHQRVRILRISIHKAAVKICHIDKIKSIHEPLDNPETTASVKKISPASVTLPMKKLSSLAKKDVRSMFTFHFNITVLLHFQLFIFSKFSMTSLVSHLSSSVL